MIGTIFAALLYVILPLLLLFGANGLAAEPRAPEHYDATALATSPGASDGDYVPTLKECVTTADCFWPEWKRPFHCDEVGSLEIAPGHTMLCRDIVALVESAPLPVPLAPVVVFGNERLITGEHWRYWEAVRLQCPACVKTRELGPAELAVVAQELALMNPPIDPGPYRHTVEYENVGWAEPIALDTMLDMLADNNTPLIVAFLKPSALNHVRAVRPAALIVSRLSSEHAAKCPDPPPFVYATLRYNLEWVAVAGRIVCRSGLTWREWMET